MWKQYVKVPFRSPEVLTSNSGFIKHLQGNVEVVARPSIKSLKFSYGNIRYTTLKKDVRKSQFVQTPLLKNISKPAGHKT